MRMLETQRRSRRRLAVVDVDLCVGCQCCMFACNRRFAEAGYAKSAIRVRSAGGMERGFVVIVCRACRNPPCAKVCPTEALEVRAGGGVILRPSKCIGCGNCVEACTIDAVSWDEKTDKPVICVHCGFCAAYCLYGVIATEAVEGSSR